MKNEVDIKLKDKNQHNLGAFVLSNHSSHNPAFFKFSQSDTQTDEGPAACVKQVANYPLPSLLPNQTETLQTARCAAADGYLSTFTIPLLAEPETLIQTARLTGCFAFLCSFTSAFMQLPDPVTRFGAIRRSAIPSPPNAQNWLRKWRSSSAFFLFFSLLPHCSRQLRSSYC